MIYIILVWVILHIESFVFWCFKYILMLILFLLLSTFFNAGLSLATEHFYTVVLLLLFKQSDYMHHLFHTSLLHFVTQAVCSNSRRRKQWKLNEYIWYSLWTILVYCLYQWFSTRGLGAPRDSWGSNKVRNTLFSQFNSQ